MNINCIICSDLFLPTSDIYVTKCGHIFHHVCLVQWIERSHTCPQCRSKTTEKTINRIFFNIVTGDSITEDAVTLQSKLDNVNLQLRMKDKQVSLLECSLNKVQNEHDDLKAQYQNISEKVSKYKDDMNALKDHILYYKEKAKNEEVLQKELKMTKDKLTAAEHIMKSINGSFDDVQTVLNECQCPKTLSSIVTSLKKELQTMEKKRNAVFTALKRKENELNLCKKNNDQMKEENSRQKLELNAHQQCEEQIQNLKKKISDIVNKAPSESLTPTLARVLNESPAPLLVKAKSNFDDDFLEITDSPSIMDRVKIITESDSPYLQVKNNNVNVLLKTPVLGARFTSTNHSIFKKSMSKENETKVKQKKPGGEFDGFGGYSREDSFPSPIQKIGGTKRTKSATISANKFRKLARPNKKLDDFLDISGIE